MRDGREDLLVNTRAPERGDARVEKRDMNLRGELAGELINVAVLWYLDARPNRIRPWGPCSPNTAVAVEHGDRPVHPGLELGHYGDVSAGIRDHVLEDARLEDDVALQQNGVVVGVGTDQGQPQQVNIVGLFVNVIVHVRDFHTAMPRPDEFGQCRGAWPVTMVTGDTVVGQGIEGPLDQGLPVDLDRRWSGCGCACRFLPSPAAKMI